MSSFTRSLVVEKIINIRQERTWKTAWLWKTKVREQYWIVDRSFEYHVGEEGSDDVINVPKGFCTDFASIPKPFWGILPPDGVYTQAAVLHDYLCVHPDRSQAEIDLIFLEAMEVLDVAKWKRNTMYQAVRAFQFAKDPAGYNKFNIV